MNNPFSKNLDPTNTHNLINETKLSKIDDRNIFSCPIYILQKEKHLNCNSSLQAILSSDYMITWTKH